jgi:hypothetical protein
VRELAFEFEKQIPFFPNMPQLISPHSLEENHRRLALKRLSKPITALP